MTEIPAGDTQAEETESAADLQGHDVDVDVVAEEPIAHPESTGHPRIDEALTRLDALDELDINDHPEQFEAIHQALRESLASAGRDGDASESP